VRDLLAPEPGRAPPAVTGKPHLLGLEVGAALAQEVGELGATALGVGTDDLRGRRRSKLGVNGGNRYYQDNSFSCTWISMIADYPT
jgi:hypothetical protein